VAGVFFILVGGIVIAGVVCLGEYVGHALLRASKMVSKTDGFFVLSFLSLFLKGTRAYIRFGTPTALF
jgi:hypothetical protein